jgi:hypothetical protein
MVEISRRSLKDLVVAHARSLFPETVPGTDGALFLVTVYDGQPGQDPDYLPIAYDDADHVRPYVCVYPSPGAPSPDVDLAGLHNDLEWSWQFTVAGAYSGDVDAVFDVLVPGFRAWTPALDEDLVPLINVGQARQLNIPGPHLLDRKITPHRVFNALQYGITVTT